MPSQLRFGLALITAALLAWQPLLAFDAPLSSEAVRDAPPWTKSPNSARSIPNSQNTSAPPATSAPTSPPPYAPKAPTSAA